MRNHFGNPTHACRGGTAHAIVCTYGFDRICGAVIQFKIFFNMLRFCEKTLMIRFVPNLKIPFFDLFHAVSTCEVANGLFNEIGPFLWQNIGSAFLWDF